MNPKVLVGCPTADSHEYCLKEYAKAVNNLSYDNYDILLVDNSEGDKYFNKIKSLGLNVIKDNIKGSIRDKIIHSRNILREKVLNEGYDYFLSLEQDVIPPKDVIERLIKHKKEYVSGVYFAHQKYENGTKLRPLLWAGHDPKTKIFYYLNDKFVMESSHLAEIDASGLGCVLIHRNILENIKFRYIKEFPTHDDMWFCKDLRESGAKLFVDLSVKCKHLINKRKWNWKEILSKE